MRPKRILITLTALACLTGVAHATPRDDLERKVAKFASDISGPYRSPCVCRDAGLVSHAGILRYGVFAPSGTTRQLGVWCETATYYYSDGSPAQKTNCQNYTLLSK
jgi:hypothetical protein